MPSVLVELDFICNPESAKYMGSEKGQKELATAIFKALEDYYDSWLQTNGKVSDRRHRDLAASSDLTEEEPSDLSAYDNLAATPLVASSKAVERKLDPAPVRNSSSGLAYAAAKRRRRSESARRISSARVVETASIPLHSESERRGRLLDNLEVAENVTAAPVDDPVADGKSKKKKKQKKVKEKKDNKSNKKVRASSHNAKIDRFVKVYKIQILASADMLKQNNPRFCGLTPISTYKENNLYKYYYGESSDKDEIEGMLREVRKKIPDAFVVSSMKSVNAAKN